MQTKRIKDILALIALTVASGTVFNSQLSYDIVASSCIHKEIQGNFYNLITFIDVQTKQEIYKYIQLQSSFGYYWMYLFFYRYVCN